MPRTLTPAQQAALRPLLKQREALERQITAINDGIYAVVQVAYGEARWDLSLDTESMVVTSPEETEAALREVLDE
jgi:hypothetical protein